MTRYRRLSATALAGILFVGGATACAENAADDEIVEEEGGVEEGE